MEFFGNVDWEHIILPSTPLVETLFRGTVIYLSLFVLLRFVLRREAGSLGITDLLVIVLLADAAQNGLADDYRSVTDGLILVGTIAFWSYLLNVLAFRYESFRKFVQPPKLLLVRDGKLIRKNLAKEKITTEELMSEIRSNGMASLDQVHEAYIEPDGMISVISKDNKAH